MSISYKFTKFEVKEIDKQNKRHMSDPIFLGHKYP
jgi:hypothetical protein